MRHGGTAAHAALSACCHRRPGWAYSGRNKAPKTMPNQPTIPPAVGRLLAGLRAFRATYYEQRPEPLRKLIG